MIREETLTDQKHLSISSLQTDYLNLESGSGRNNEKENLDRVKCNFCGGSHQKEKCLKKGQDREKTRMAGDSYRQRTERPP